MTAGPREVVSRPQWKRLTRHEIAFLRDLVLRAGASGRVTPAARQRGLLAGLRRRGIIEVWYRQNVDQPSLEGPFVSLTIPGFHLACAFVKQRRSSHALQGP